MDKEQAKFILSSFSGSEADSKEEVFKEALELVVSDTELSEWFLKERKFDEAFMKAFESFTVPEDLREQVLAVLDPNIEIEQDELEIIGALATIQPPAGLREQILLGMEQTQPQEVKKGESNIIKMFFPLAAAAVVATQSS